MNGYNYEAIEEEEESKEEYEFDYKEEYEFDYKEEMKDEKKTDDELNSFSFLFEKIMKDISLLTQTKNVSCKIYLNCENIENTYIIHEIDIHLKYQMESKIDIYYNVFHLSEKVQLFTSLKFEYENKEKLIHFIFDIFWSYKLCPECLSLIENKNELCYDCTFHKMRQQYGLLKKYIHEHHKCMICQEHVYNTKLQCGHYIHHTCLLQLHSYQWFYETIDIKCGLCRQNLTEYDKHKYFYIK
jgi:hypothetical protein